MAGAGLTARPAAASWQAVSSELQGINEKACRSPVEISTPTPTISPRSLIVSGDVKYKLESAGIRVFKSTIEPFCHKKHGIGSRRKKQGTILPPLGWSH